LRKSSYFERIRGGACQRWSTLSFSQTAAVSARRETLTRKPCNL